jgi:hypothetical protein
VDDRRGDQEVIALRDLSSICVIAVIAAFSSTTLACPGDVQTGDVVVPVEKVENVSSTFECPVESDYTNPLPSKFPMSFVSHATDGLHVRSLLLVGGNSKESGLHPWVEFQVEFVWGHFETAQQDWQSPVEVYMVGYDENLQQQFEFSSQPTIRATTGNPIAVSITGRKLLAPNCKGCWTTLVVVGRDSKNDPARLLASQTKFVSFESNREDLSSANSNLPRTNSTAFESWRSPSPIPSISPKTCRVTGPNCLRIDSWNCESARLTGAKCYRTRIRLRQSRH